MARLLTEQRRRPAARVGAPLEIVGIAVRRPARTAPRPASTPRCSRPTPRTWSPGADVVVEVIGGIEPARSAHPARDGARRRRRHRQQGAARRGRPDALRTRPPTHGVDLYYEAAVAGAIPLLRPLRESLAGDDVRRVLGIVNGTTNYVLDKMDSTGAGFADARRARPRRWATPRPTRPPTSRASTPPPRPRSWPRWPSTPASAAGDVYREGITEVTAADVAAARRWTASSSCSPSASAPTRTADDGVSVRVHPAMIPRTHPLAGVREAFNAVFVEADAAGQLMFYGRGAGGDPTASRRPRRHRRRRPGTGSAAAAGRGSRAYADLPILPMGEATTRYHISLDVLDRPGVLAQVATAFADHDVSIETVRQQLLSTDPDEPAATVAPASSSSPTPPPTRPCRPRWTPSRRCPPSAASRPSCASKESDHGPPVAWCDRGVPRPAAVPAGAPVVTLGEGGTPLIPAAYLSSVVGAEVLVKYEGLNPTGSFKDRGMTTAISVAARAGAKAVICASTGNTSASAAAYATKAGMTCGVLVPEGKIALGKLSQAIAHGATLLQVDGNFDDCLTLARKLAESYPVELVNSVNPARIEGQKTAAFEVVDALGDAPDIHCLPVGNAGNITAYWRGYREYCQDAAMPGRPRTGPACGASRPRGPPRSCWATPSTTPRPSPRRSGSATPRPGPRPSRPATTPAA